VDAEQLLSVVLGAVVVLLGVVLFVRLPSGPERWVFAVSYALVGVFYALWPPETDVWLDHVTGVTGLGILLWACTTTVAISLQVTFHCMINDRALWWVRTTPALAAGIVAAYTALWALARQGAGPATSYLLYDGYHGDPPAVLCWNLLVAAGIALVCGLAAREQLRPVLGETVGPDAAILGAIYIVGVAYACTIAGQALASHLGYGATTVVPIIHVVRLVGVVVATGLAAWSVIGLDLWAIASLWWRTRRLERQEGQLTFLVVVLSDRLVWRHAPQAASQLAQLARRCARRDRAARTSGKHIVVALQAARRITWRRGVLVKGIWDDAPDEDRIAADRSIAAEAALDVATGSAPVSEIGHVIRLVLADVSLPAWLAAPLPPPTTGHAAAAALLAPYFGKTGPIPALSAAPTPSPTRQAAVASRGIESVTTRRWMRTWYHSLSTRHARAETNLMIVCELIEDYLLQIDAPDDNDLAISVWTLDSAQGLSPFQVEIAQRASQVLALFGPRAVRCAPWSRSRRAIRLPSPLPPMGRRAGRYPSEQSGQKVTLWCTIAMVVKAVIDPACVPVDGGTWRMALNEDGGVVAGIIREAAQGVRQGE
jgi:hypothetical protein